MDRLLKKEYVEVNKISLLDAKNIAPNILSNQI